LSFVVRLYLGRYMCKGYMGDVKLGVAARLLDVARFTLVWLWLMTAADLLLTTTALDEKSCK